MSQLRGRRAHSGQRSATNHDDDDQWHRSAPKFRAPCEQKGGKGGCERNRKKSNRQTVLVYRITPRVHCFASTANETHGTASSLTKGSDETSPLRTRELCYTRQHTAQRSSEMISRSFSNFPPRPPQFFYDASTLPLTAAIRGTME